MTFDYVIIFIRSLAPDDPPEVATGVANLADLVKFLKERFGDGGNDGGVIIALKNAERLRDMDANLLPGFLRLKELTRLPVCVLLISKIAWEVFLCHIIHITQIILYFVLTPFTLNELFLHDMTRNYVQVKIHGAIRIAAPSPRHCAAIHEGANV